MKSTNAQGTQQRLRRIDLDSRYGAIGISAVAAALQYKSEPKNPTTPSATEPADDRWTAGIAA